MPTKVGRKFVWRGHTGPVYALVAHPEEERFFYSCGGDGRIIAWALGEKKQRWAVRLNHPIYTMTAIASLGCLAVGGNQEGILLYSLQEGRKMHIFPIQNEIFYDLCAHKAHLMAAQQGGSLRILNLNARQEQHEIALSAQRLRCVRVNPDAQECVVGGTDAIIRVVDLHTYAVKQMLRAHEKSVFSLCFTPNYSYLLSACKGAEVNVWQRAGVDGGGYRLLRRLRGHRGAVNEVAVSGDGRYFLSGSLDRTLKLWKTESLSLLGVIDTMRHRYHRGSVNGVLWLSDSPMRFLSCSDDAHVVLWEADGSR